MRAIRISLSIAVTVASWSCTDTIPNQSGVYSSPTPPVVTSVVPSVSMLDPDLNAITVLGSNFTSSSEVLLDGQRMYVWHGWPPPEDSTTTIVASLGGAGSSSPPSFQPGTWHIEVQDGSYTSNEVLLVVYAADPGPTVLQAPVSGGTLAARAGGSLSCGDVDGDGLPDLLANGEVFLNLGGGRFSRAATPSVPANAILADLTGSGRADLVAAQPDRLWIWPNDRTPGFSSTPTMVPVSLTSPMAAVDLDGDGHMDIVAANALLFGDGAYHFTAVTTPYVATSPESPFLTGDFDGDGRLDVVAATFTLLNRGNRTFEEGAHGLPTKGGVAGDFDADGRDEIALLGYGKSVSLLRREADGAFVGSLRVVAGQVSGALALADFDGDGVADLAAVGKTSPQVALFFHADQGRFSRSYAGSGTVGSRMLAADLDGDGKPDLAIVDDSDPTSPTLEIALHQ